MRGNLLGVFLALAATLSTNKTVQAAHSRRRLVRPAGGSNRYDREITTFSEDGRLLQVEYGLEASRRGSTIVALRTNEGICWVVPQSSFGKVHRIDDHLWLLTAGLSGDARLLSDALRNTCQKHRLAYGEAPTTKQIAQVAGEAQHQLTYTAGARPLGCTAMVLGIDAPFDDSGKRLGKPCIYQTDPGGVVQECASFTDDGSKQAGVGGKDGNQISRILPDLMNGRLFNDNSRSWWFSKKSKEKKKTDKNTDNGKSDETEALDDDSSKEPDELSKLAAKLAEQVLKLEDEQQQHDSDAPLPTVDVWIIRPDTRRRGGQHAICYQNINKKDSLLDQIITYSG
ncbi:unnamed protein product [Cylindrotheca closterium]|uniref:Proteasome alpha-type subunits domain-containing protein n=1 Tax=Cylindrotheca closterium TaxID=2856 RepID=A0AAD2FW97_9STRA|nr:unnamed protein product [Cylindrotheca closterium]